MRTLVFISVLIFSMVVSFAQVVLADEKTKIELNPTPEPTPRPEEWYSMNTPTPAPTPTPIPTPAPTPTPTRPTWGTPTDEEIKIGVFYPMTKKASGFGQEGWKGLKLAHRERPDVLGKKVKLILVDNKSDEKESAKVVSRLIEKENVVAIIGGLIRSNTLAGAATAEKAKIPMISPSVTDPLLTENREYIFRACFTDAYQGFLGAKFAREELKAKTVAVMVDITWDYSIETAKSFIKNFEEIKGKIIMKTFYQGTYNEYLTTQLSAISQTRPDLIYIPGRYEHVVKIVRQVRELGITIPFMSGGAAKTDELIKSGGDAVEGLYLTAHFDEKGVTTESGRRFVQLFHETYKQTPDSVSALSWDTYNILLDAIEGASDSQILLDDMEKVGSIDATRIRDKLTDIRGFQGATGVVILKVENRKFVYVSTIKPPIPRPIVGWPPSRCPSFMDCD